MPRAAVFFVPEPGSAGLAPPEINASLFYQLAQFIVWGEQHGELAAAHPDLAALLQTAAMALSKGGIPEHPSGSIPPGSGDKQYRGFSNFGINDGTRRGGTVKNGRRSTTLSYCVTCQRETPHELRRCEGSRVKICARCLERVLQIIGVGSGESVAQ